MSRLAKYALVLAAIVAGECNVARAADVTSFYSGPSANWSAAQWINAPTGYPNNGNGGFTYDAVFSGGNTLTLDQGITIQRFNLNGSVLTGTFDLTTNDLLHWTGGTMSGTGTTNANGGLSIDGYTNFLDTRTLNNPGSATFTGNGLNQDGNLFLSNGATFNNSGTFDAGWAANYNNSIRNNGGTATFNNTGTFTRSVGTGTTTVSIPFNNSNIVTVQAGTFSINGGGTESGSFQVASGAVFTIGGSGNTLAAGSAFTGPGIINIVGIATITAPLITFSGGGSLHLTGTLNGAGTLTAASPIEWTGGTMSGTGTTNVNGGLSIDGYTNFLDAWTLNNGGTTTFTGNGPNQDGNLFLSNEATFNNSGTFDAGWAANYNNSIRNNGGTATFNNTGAFTRTVGTGTTTVSITFNNSGTVNVQAGTVALSGGGLDTGSFQIPAGGTLSFGGSTTLMSAASLAIVGGTVNINGPTTVNTSALTGTGTVNILGSGALTLNVDVATASALNITNGTLNGSGALTVSGAVHWTGGTMSGSGTTSANGGLTIDGYTDFLDTRTLNNGSAATFTGNVPNQDGNLFLSNGATFNNSGTFDAGWAANYNNSIRNNGGTATFNNTGAFTRSVGTGTTTVSITFNNSGTVNVQAGTVALSGGGLDAGSFQILAGATLGFAGSTNLTSTASLAIVGGTVNINGPTTLNTTALTGSGTLSILASGTLTVVPDISTSLALNIVGGTLNGGGTLTVAGTTHWTGGTMSGVGTTTANGGLQIDGYVNALDGRTLNIGAPATFTGNAPNQAGYLDLPNSATINNSSTFDSGWATNFDNNIRSPGGTGTFNNLGTFTRSVGTGTTTVEVSFNSSGAVNVQAGALALNGGGLDSGSFQVPAGATLGFAGSTNLTSTASLSIDGRLNINGPTTLNTNMLTGSGALNILANGTLTVAPNISTSLALNIVGGTLNGGGTLTVAGATHWTGGTMSGVGTTTANGGLQIDGYVNALDGRTLNIGAPATFTGNAPNQAGYLDLPNSATINNSSTFDSGWATNFDNNIRSPGGTGTFNNLGTFTRSVGTGTTTVEVSFKSSGAVNVQAGALALNGGGLDSGSFQVPAGATLGFAGSTNLTSTASLSIDGRLNINGPTTLNTNMLTGSGALNILANGTLTVAPNISTSLALNIVGGTLNGGGALTVSGATHWTGGTMSGVGTTTANGGLQIDGYVNALDGRTLNIGAPATFTGNAPNQAGYLDFSNSATINNSSTFDAGWATNFDNNIRSNGGTGTFNNLGTFTRSVGSGTTTVNVPFTNNGIVDLKVGKLELAGGLTVGSNSVLKVSAGVLKISSTSGTPHVGSGAMALISDSGVLQLAGSVSSLGVASPAADRVAISNNNSAAAGLLVSAGNHQVGAIGGTGTTQVDAGASLTADSIIQTALVIGGAPGNRGTVTISPSDDLGQPLGAGLASAEGAAFKTSIEVAGQGALPISADNLGAISFSAPGNVTAVPEPSTVILAVTAALAALAAGRLRRRRAARVAP